VKVALVNTHDAKGGAARAAMRLHHGLIAAGVDSHFWAQSVTGRNPAVRGPASPRELVGAALRPYVEDAMVRRWGGPVSTPWSAGLLPSRLHRAVRSGGFDAVNLHWTNAGFVSVGDIGRMPGPLVLTLHDLWAFTGGCHYPAACRRFEGACGSCPQLGSSRDSDLSRRVHRAKTRHWSGRRDLCAVSPSAWLAREARASSLFRNHRVELIPNGIDVRAYAPRDRAAARQLLGLPADRTVILFVEDSRVNPRKGFHLLEQALRGCVGEEWVRTAMVAVVGRTSAPEIPGFPCEIRVLGRYADDLSLSVAYSAVDVLAAPAVEEAFGLTLIEAMSCGVPVVAFRAGGPGEIVTDGTDGLLVAPGDVTELAGALRVLAGDRALRERLGDQARRTVEARFDIRLVAAAYQRLFSELGGPAAPTSHD